MKNDYAINIWLEFVNFNNDKEMLSCIMYRFPLKYNGGYKKGPETVN